MAQVSFDDSAITSLMKQLEVSGPFADKVAEEMLFAGAEILAKEAQEQFIRAGYPAREVYKNIGFIRKVKKDKSGIKSVSITVKGKDNRGEGNAVKAFVLNYGRGKRYGEIKGSHFWNRAKEKAQPEMSRKCEEIATKHLKEKGLI